MTSKSVLQEAREVQLASVLIGLGARLQFLESAVSLSRERLVRLYKEIKGVSPPKGLLPFSADWYMTWLANIHASLFFNIFLHMSETHPGQLEALIAAYEMYLQQVQIQGDTAILDFTRAYTLVQFHKARVVQLTSCSRCSGRFITHGYEGRNPRYVCVLCSPPSRAGKPARARSTPDPAAARIPKLGGGHAAASDDAAASGGTTPARARKEMR